MNICTKALRVERLELDLAMLVEQHTKNLTHVQMNIKLLDLSACKPYLEQLIAASMEVESLIENCTFADKHRHGLVLQPSFSKDGIAFAGGEIIIASELLVTTHQDLEELHVKFSNLTMSLRALEGISTPSETTFTSEELKAFTIKVIATLDEYLDFLKASNSLQEDLLSIEEAKRYCDGSLLTMDSMEMYLLLKKAELEATGFSSLEGVNNSLDYLFLAKRHLALFLTVLGGLKGLAVTSLNTKV